MDRWGGDFVLWWITDPRRCSPLKNVLCPSAQGSEPCHPYGPQVMESPNCGWLGWWGCQLWKADEPLRLVGALGSLSPNLGKPLYKKKCDRKVLSVLSTYLIYYFLQSSYFAAAGIVYELSWCEPMCRATNTTWKDVGQLFLQKAKLSSWVAGTGNLSVLVPWSKLSWQAEHWGLRSFTAPE